MSDATVTTGLLVVGNEILSGRTRDANIQYLGAALGEMGICLTEVRIVPDDVPVIVEALDALRGRHPYVFTTGGIGPTHDDVTALAVARAFNVSLHPHPEAIRRLEHYYGADINAARLKMAQVPQGAELIDNPISAAPGFIMGRVFVMAGVPRIMQAMFEGIRHNLKGGARMCSATITILVGEGQLAGGLAEVQMLHPGVEIGSYPFQRGMIAGVNVVLRGIEPDAVQRARSAVMDLAAGLNAEIVPQS